MFDVNKAIYACDDVICRNIESFTTEQRGLLSQNILSQLRNFVENIFVKVYISLGGEPQRKDYDTIRVACSYVKALQGEYRFLSQFHKLLQISVSHYTLDPDSSERLMLKDTAPQKALSRIGQFIRSCRPVFTFDELTRVPKVTIDVAPQEEESTLKEIFDYLGSSEKRCYIAIDEFQQIAEYQEKGIEASLRSYIQFLPNVNFIFAGSKQHLMQEMFMSSKRPFYQSTQLLTIGPINREAYACFAIRHFAEHGVQLPREVFDTIYDKFDGHTWYIQCLLNRLYGYNQNVDKELVAYATGQIVSEQSYSYADLLKAYSAGHIRLLKAIAREGCVKEVLAGDFISRHRLRAASSVSASLKKLLDNELVYQTPCGYIIYDRFMNEWLRQQPF